MDKLKMESMNLLEENIKKIGEVFPNVIVETEKGKMIDFDLLKQELSKNIIEVNKEKYQLTWAGKNKAIIASNTPSTNTFRPIKEKSVDFENTKNIYIEGDNLDALKILQESYLNKIKCIYIDPPYNTGNDFIYNDDFTKNVAEELLESGQIDLDGNRLVSNKDSNGRFHSDWLSMMYPRLKLARNLLTDDGVIFISIDDNELFNLKRLCDEIFGESSFVANIGLEITKTQGMKVKSAKEGSVVKNYEYMLCYAKSNASKRIVKNVLYDANNGYDTHFSTYINLNTLETKNITDIFESDKRIKDEFEKYNLKISISNIEVLLSVSTAFKDILYKELANNIFQLMACNITLPDNIMSELDNKGIVKYNDYLLSKSSGNKIRQYSSLKETLNYSDEYNSEFGRVTIRGNLWKNFYSDMMNVAKEGNIDFPNGKKPIRLVLQIMKWIGLENEIILDFFSGSATTAHSTIKYNAISNANNRFILIQFPENLSGEFENICELGQERIRRAGNKIKEETNANIDYGFRVYKIDSSNMKDVYYRPEEFKQQNLTLFETNVKEDRNELDLLTQVILDLGLKLDLSINEKNIGKNKVYFVDSNSLVACFDDNVDIEVVEEICKVNPLKVVFKDDSFKYDNDKINLQEKFKKLSPDTEISII